MAGVARAAACILAAAIGAAPAAAAESEAFLYGDLPPLPSAPFTVPATPATPAPPAAAPTTGTFDGMPAYAAAPVPAHNPGGIVDEVRLGGTAFWQDNHEGTEDGLFLTGQVLFDPLPGAYGNILLDILLKPRPHFGASLSTAEGTNQVFGGLTWTLPVPPIFFLEASFGGTLHDGELEGTPGVPGLSLGCHLLFRESLGAGVELGEHWRALASVDHSSHADLCGDLNSGLTHIGGSLGYRF
jgi:hypothetical protein